MQPTYLPWLGYFDLIDQCDIFVLLDDVQFVKKSWQLRNRIKTAAGPLWLSVPVLSSGRRFQKISETEIDNTQNWREKHFKSILHAYANAPYANDYCPELQNIYQQEWKKICEINETLILFIKKAMGIQTPIIRSSNLKCREDMHERIIDICRQVDADVLYDAQGASEIIDPDILKANGVRIMFQEYQHPLYKQQNGAFVPYISAIDLLLNEGPSSCQIVRSGSKSIHNGGSL
jgi:hypothetical protein